MMRTGWVAMVGMASWRMMNIEKDGMEMEFWGQGALKGAYKMDGFHKTSIA